MMPSHVPMLAVNRWNPAPHHDAPRPAATTRGSPIMSFIAASPALI